MDRTKRITFLFQNGIFYGAGILVILGMKLYYRQADCDSLLWVLAPTAWWVEFLSRIPFRYVSGAGYVNHDLRLLIAPSCSGVRFMIILFATLVFSFVHVAASVPAVSSRKAGNLQALQGVDGELRGKKILRREMRGFAWIIISMLMSWVCTVFVNGLRIIAAIFLPIYLKDAGLMGGVLTQDRLHTVIGVVVYFASLIAIYHLVDYLIGRRRAAWKCASPVFWYFVLTLGLPLLRGGRGEGMEGKMEFTAVVLIGCLFVLLVYSVGTILCRRRKNSC